MQLTLYLRPSLSLSLSPCPSLPVPLFPLLPLFSSPCFSLVIFFLFVSDPNHNAVAAHIDETNEVTKGEEEKEQDDEEDDNDNDDEEEEKEEEDVRVKAFTPLHKCVQHGFTGSIASQHHNM